MYNRFVMVSMDTDVEVLLVLSQNNLAFIQNDLAFIQNTFFCELSNFLSYHLNKSIIMI